jgi:hypothetical protein
MYNYTTVDTINLDLVVFVCNLEKKQQLIMFYYIVDYMNVLLHQCTIESSFRKVIETSLSEPLSNHSTMEFSLVQFLYSEHMSIFLVPSVK